MPNTIQHKRSITPGAVPSAGALAAGELAVNTADGRVFAKKDDGSVVDVAATRAHKSSHATGGTDALTPADIGAASIPTSPLAITKTGDYIIAQSPLHYVTTTPQGIQIGDTYYALSGKFITNWSYSESSLSTSGGPVLTSLGMSDLRGVTGAFSVTANSLTSLSFPELAFVGGNMSASGTLIASISFPSLLYSGNLNIVNNSVIQQFNFPSLRLVGGQVQLGNSPVATSVELPVLEVVRGNLTLTNLPLVTSISLPMLRFAAGSTLAIEFSNALTSVSLPSLVAVSSLRITGNPSLTSVTLNANIRVISGNFDVFGCALPVANIDALLQTLAALDGTNGTIAFGSGRSANLSGGTNAAPTSISTTTRAGSSFVCAGTTCTVNWTGHGYATGDVLRISGITTATNANRYARITVVNANQFTYAITSQTATGAGTATVRLTPSSINALITRGVNLTTN